MNKTLILLFAILFVFAAGLSAVAQEEEEKKEPEKKEKLKADPATEKHHKLAAAYNAKCSGVTMLVMLDGKIIFEDYPNGGSKDRAYLLASGTKSFNGIMAIVAAKEGLLSLDEKVCKTITEWKDDPRKSKITIRQLLTLTGGLEAGTSGSDSPTYAEAVKAECINEPGEKFTYGPVPFQVFGEVMCRKLADKEQGPLEYLEEKVFKPIGLEYGRWGRKEDGNPNLPGGAALSAREWAKFGELVRCEGRWKDEQVLDPKLLKECFKSTKANPAYGLTWWLNNKVEEELKKEIPQLTAASDVISGKDLPEDLAFAAGAGKQRLYVIPSLKLVVVRQANNVRQSLRGKLSKFSDVEFLGRLLYGKATEEAGEGDEASGEEGSRKRLIDILGELDLTEKQFNDLKAAFGKHKGGLRNPDLVKELQRILTEEQWKKFQEEIRKLAGGRRR